MDSYQDSIRSATRSNDGDSSPTERRSQVPTAIDVAQWKVESDRFLDDVERRLNDILAEVTQRHLIASPSVFQPVAQETSESVLGGHEQACASASDGDRISALKAQLARKLHNFEESNEYSTEELSDGEVR